MTNLLFCAISCNGDKDGAWARFADFVEESQPSFVVMMGDQVYMDEDPPDIFEQHFDSDAETRRKAMAEKYRPNWSRDVVRRVLANFPCYMMWDDHDIRDGWGSLASDSPTMASASIRAGRRSFASRPRSSKMRAMCTGISRAAATRCRRPCRPARSLPTRPGVSKLHRQAHPARRAHRECRLCSAAAALMVMVLDSRGERDIFRAKHPILGARQWTFIEQVFARLPADVDALAVVTATPIASQDPDGQTQRLFGDRTDDVEAFKRGDEKELFSPKSSESKVELLKVIASRKIAARFGVQPNLGDFKISALDEARDQWSHRFSRPEQQDLLKKSFAARFTNRTAASGRALLFLSGDIHVGCIFDVSSRLPRGKAVSMTSSGISQIDDTQPLVGTFIDEEFSLAPGISSTLRDAVNEFNFGVIQVQPTGNGAEISAVLAHEGNSSSSGWT